MHKGRCRDNKYIKQHMLFPSYYPWVSPEGIDLYIYQPLSQQKPIIFWISTLVDLKSVMYVEV